MMHGIMILKSVYVYLHFI